MKRINALPTVLWLPGCGTPPDGVQSSRRGALARAQILLWGLLAACGGGDDGNPLLDAGGDASGWTSSSFVFDPISWDDGRALVTAMRFVPDTTELVVLEHEGLALHYAVEGDSARLLGSFEVPNVHHDSDCGLISLAFDPDFERNHFLYLGYCVDRQNSGIFRVVFDPPDYEAVAGTIQEVIVVGDSRSERAWHNIGSIGFDPEGNLWALFGDKTVTANGQDRTDNLGALLRIVPNRDPSQGGYTPAPGNPWDAEEASPDVYAYGLRSPWRGTLDQYGRYWIGDVGDATWEEVNLVTEPGQNLGWGAAEGPCTEDCEGLTEPLTAWKRGVTDPYVDQDLEAEPSTSQVVWVGPEVRPATVERYEGRLNGRVIFGDFCLGFVRAAEADEAGQLVFDEPMAHLAHLSALEQGSDGYLYAATYGSCQSGGDGQTSQLYRLRLR